MDEEYEMPDKTVALLVMFLDQNKGQLSKRALEKEFSKLQPDEVQQIEKTFRDFF
jgi:hypothetical protein